MVEVARSFRSSEVAIWTDILIPYTLPFALTGIRSEYDLLYPLLHALTADDAFEVGVIACGAHLTSLHDYSIRHIRDDGFRIVDEIENLLFSDSTASKARSAGLLLQGLAQTLARETPDLLVVLGDREGTLVELPGRGIVALDTQEHAQVVHRARSPGVVGTEELLADGEDPFEHRPRRGVVSLVLV